MNLFDFSHNMATKRPRIYDFLILLIAIDRLGITMGHQSVAINGSRSKSMLYEHDRLFRTGTPEAIKVYFVCYNLRMQFKL